MGMFQENENIEGGNMDAEHVPEYIAERKQAESDLARYEAAFDEVNHQVIALRSLERRLHTQLQEVLLEQRITINGPIDKRMVFGEEGPMLVEAGGIERNLSVIVRELHFKPRETSDTMRLGLQRTYPYAYVQKDNGDILTVWLESKSHEQQDQNRDPSPRFGIFARWTYSW
jgi:hypothetical protein